MRRRILLTNFKCTGCMACYAVCPNKAIEISVNEKGFYVPKVNNEKCTNCGLCDKICPINSFNNYTISTDKTNPEIHACAINNYSIKMKSSSGGFFSVLIDYVLKLDGYVCGCILDENLIAKHIISNDLRDIEKMRGSKYIQSNIGDCFNKIKQLLENDKYVLFSGTPCQCAGLSAVLRKKYDKLIIADVLCTCVNPPYILKEYIDSITEGNINEIKEVSFKNKITGWENFSFLLKWIDKENKERVNYEPILSGMFYQGFLSHLWMKNSCEQCLFNNSKRYADFTIGDFWGIKTYKEPILDDEGTSFVLLNSDKANRIFNEVKSQLDFDQIIDYDWGINTQPVLNGKGYNKHPNNSKFFEYSPKHYSPIELTKDLLGINKVGILTYDFSTNYGAQLQAWALCEQIKKLGFTPKILRWDEKFHENFGNEKDNLEAFREEYLPRTKMCYTEQDLHSEIFDCNKIIIGSDQVFRNWSNFNYHAITRYFGDFVYGKKTLAAYAASFGFDFFNGCEYIKNECKKLIKRFDKIGVREKSAVNIVKNTFDCEAVEVLDPVFFLNEEEFSNLLINKNLHTPKEEYIAYMILKNDDGLGQIDIKLIKNLLCKNFVNINVNQDKEGERNTVEQWINYIKNAQFVITDSFHCLVFSIIFKKNFIVVLRDYGGNSRILDLLEKFNLTNHLRTNIADITNDDLNIDIDWNNVYKILAKEKQKSIDFLLDILLLKPTIKEKYVNDEIKLIRDRQDYDYQLSMLHKLVNDKVESLRTDTRIEQQDIIERINQLHKLINDKIEFLHADNCIKQQNILEKMNKQRDNYLYLFYLLTDKNKIYFKYFLYKLIFKLSLIKNAKLKAKTEKYKQQIKELRNLKKI